METVETFSRGMIEKFLTSRDFGYDGDDGGDFVLQIEHSDGCGRELTVILAAAAGERGAMLSVIASPRDSNVPVGRWADAVLACNQWNLDHPYPKATFRTGISHDKSAEFSADGTVTPGGQILCATNPNAPDGNIASLTWIDDAERIQGFLWAPA